MKTSVVYKGLLLIYILLGISGAISVSFTSGGSGGQSSIGSNYNLDNSAGLIESATLGGGSISSGSLVEGSGINSIAKTATNNVASVSSSLTSSGALSAATSSYASGTSAGLEQNVYATGQLESGVSGLSGSRQAAQKAGVLNGALASSQIVTADAGTVNAVQSSNIAGALGYSDGQAQTSDDTVKVTGGLNGVGVIRSTMITTASGGASASGSVDAEPGESKGYSAVKSTSPDGETFSYLSSAGQLTSSLRASANGHVIADQNLEAKGDVKVYANSLSEDSSSKSYSATGEAVSGSLSASAGSPALIGADLQGALQSTTPGIVPTPGSWIWSGLGGYLTTTPYQLRDDQGGNHAFAKGGDNGLWDNFNGDWQGLGGSITSDPSAVVDSQSKIHVLVRGGDGALWDRVLGGSWTGLGGYITSNPSAALSSDNHIKVAAKGGDNALWLKDLTTGSWSPLGGSIASNPKAILDYQGKMHVLVKGSDGALWDNVNGAWQFRDGLITSDAMPALNPYNTNHVYTFARGNDGTLLRNDLDINSNTASWQGLGGYISQNGGLNKGNPAPVADSDGVMHAFVRGRDGALWDNANGNWYSLGGYLTSDPNAIRDKDWKIRAAAIGGDNSAWVNTLGINQASTRLVGPIGCDYTKVQPAVDAASTGSVIKLMSGTYNGVIQIDKSLTLKGIGAGKTIVDGGKAGSVFTIGEINPSANVALSGMTIQNGQADFGGGIHNSGTLSVTDSIISGNAAGSSGGNGGGIYNEDNGRVTLLRDSLIGNTALWNGAGIANSGSLTIISCTISQNTANLGVGPILGNGGYGGGIFNYRLSERTDRNLAILNLVGSTVSGNSADIGGGIYNDGTATLTNSLITRNKANVGAGVDDWTSGKLTIQGGTISGNVAQYNAGGIENAGTATTISGVTISDNTAVNGFGGGIYNYRDLGEGGTITPVATITNSVITRNTAQLGGGIFNYGVASLIETTISANIATSEGGGIYNCADYPKFSTARELTIQGGSISGNTAYSNGGGIANMGAATVIGSTFSSNTATNGDGGGIYNYGDSWSSNAWIPATLSLTGSTISSNIAADIGGGIYNDGTATLADSAVSENRANSGGGGIYSDADGRLTVQGASTISGNTATNGQGGGIRNDGSLFIGGTTQILNNQATMGWGGGIYSDTKSVTFDGTKVAVKQNKAHNPSPSEPSWYRGWGVYLYTGTPIMIGEFNQPTQVTGNTRI